MYYLQILTLSVGVIFCSFWHYLSFRDDNVSFRDVLPRTVFYGSSSTFIPSSLSSSVSSSISFIRFRNALILPAFSSCAVLHAMLYVRNYSLISCIYCFVFSAVGMFVANSTAVSSLECLRLLKLIMLQCASHFMLSRELMRIFKRYMHEHYFHDIGGDTGISNSTLYQVNQQTCKECHTRANWQCPAWLRFQVYCLQAELMFISFRFCCCHS
uniref:Uncharacterized protein n=1 Tax=Cacopsylla melanoneura TaxID=428564 RepID=A0A8D8QJ29_9HEMI